MKNAKCIFLILIALACSPKPEKSLLTDTQVLIESDQTYFSESMFDSIPEAVKTQFNAIKYAEPVCRTQSSCQIGLPDGSSFSLADIQSYFNTFDGTIRITSFTETAPTTYPESSIYYPSWGRSGSSDPSPSYPDIETPNPAEASRGGGGESPLSGLSYHPLEENLSDLINNDIQRRISYSASALDWQSPLRVGMSDQIRAVPSAPFDVKQISTNFKSFIDGSQVGLVEQLNESTRRDQADASTTLNLFLSIESQKFNSYSEFRNQLNFSTYSIFQDASNKIQNADFHKADSNLEELAAKIKQSRIDRSTFAQSVRAKLPEVEISVKPARFKTDSLSMEGRAVRRANTYIDFGNRLVSDSANNGEGRRAANKLLSNAQETLAIADSAYSNQNSLTGDAGLHIVYSLVDAAISLAPLVAMVVAPELVAVTMAVALAKDWYEARTGKGLLTGDLLTPFQRSLASIGVAAAIIMGPVGSIAKGTQELSKAVGLTEELMFAGKKAGEISEIREVTRITEEVLDSAKKLGVDGKDIAGIAKEVDHLAPGKVVDIYEAAAKNTPLGLGSTGRTVPNNLKEQAAMIVTRADPQAGEILPLVLTDSRWPATDGWQKMQTVFKTSEGRNVVIHYVRNKVTGIVDDFKFKN